MGHAADLLPQAALFYTDVWEIPEIPEDEESPYSIDEGDVWVSFETEDGYTAYKHGITGQVSWEKPTRLDMMSNPMGRDSIEI